MRVKIVLIVLISVLLNLGCKKEKSRICELYENPVGYAIGTIDKMNSTPFKATFIYSFYLEGVKYKGKEKAYGIGQKDNKLINKSFVVVFEFGNPYNSDLNTDFKIDSELDFDNFIAEYSTQTPPPDFPNKCK